MLFSEFVEGANVKADMLSWSVYSMLEKIYMKHDDITKEEIIKYGRTCCDDLHAVARSDVKTRIDVWYHGIHGQDPQTMFSHTCGRCCRSVKYEFLFCPYCGAEFIKESTGSAGENKEKEI